MLTSFESRTSKDNSFLETIHNIISECLVNVTYFPSFVFIILRVERESSVLYGNLFHDTSIEVGKTLSKSERHAKNLDDDKSLIYGEVEYDSFYDVLRLIHPQHGQVFYDLGSGTGKV